MRKISLTFMNLPLKLQFDSGFRLNHHLLPLVQQEVFELDQANHLNCQGYLQLVEISH